MNENDSMKITQEVGGITLAVLTGVDTTTYRATATFLDTGGSQICTFAPSGGHGEMPLEGSLCAVYRKGQFFCQFIKELNDFTPSTDLSVSQRVKSGSEIIVGSAPVLDPGEMYIGRLGRAVFNNAGSVTLSTQTGAMSLQLNDKTQVSSLTGNNYMLSTPDTAIRIITESSIPTSYGDKIRIEKNIPQPYIVPGELKPYGSFPITPSLAYIQIDEFNAITASVLVAGPAVNSIMELDELGNVKIGNVLGYMSVDPLGDVSIFSSLDIGMQANGDITALAVSGAEMDLLKTGLAGIKNRLASVTLDPLGNVTIFGDKIVGIEGTNGVTVTSTSGVTVNGLTINLNSGTEGVARIGDTVLSSSISDALFWSYMTSIQASLVALYAAITTAPAGLASSYQAAMAAILASAPVPIGGAVPISITSRITTGSLTVKAGN